MNFVNYQELMRDIKSFALKVPEDVDVIVGIPRSGLMVASILVLYMNKSLGTIVDGKITILRGGERDEQDTPVRQILVLDDSVNSGQTIKNTARTLLNANCLVIFGCIYKNPDYKLKILYERDVAMPRLFEWNFMNSDMLGSACVDMDGVLCVDPKPEEIDYGPKYLKFLKNTKPLYVPKREIHSIVTARPERYRLETEVWLKNHGIKYKHLIMRQYESFNIKDFKLAAYATSPCKIFIESNADIAFNMGLLSTKPLICIENMQVIG